MLSRCEVSRRKKSKQWFVSKAMYTIELWDEKRSTREKRKKEKSAVNAC